MEFNLEFFIFLGLLAAFAIVCLIDEHKRNRRL
jgi:hypothetical protein